MIQTIPEGHGQPGDAYDDGKPAAPVPVQENVASTPLKGVPSSNELPVQVVVAPQAGPEDATSFEQCDIAINILLLRQDEHPSGRIVNIVVHNFAGIVVAQDYRAAELTKASLLDNLQKGIHAVMQQFLLKQATERQKKLETQATNARQPVAASPTPSATSTVPARPTITKQTTTPTKIAITKNTSNDNLTQYELF